MRARSCGRLSRGGRRARRGGDARLPGCAHALPPRLRWWRRGFLRRRTRDGRGASRDARRCTNARPHREPSLPATEREHVRAPRARLRRRVPTHTHGRPRASLAHRCVHTRPAAGVHGRRRDGRRRDRSESEPRRGTRRFRARLHGRRRPRLSSARRHARSRTRRRRRCRAGENPLRAGLYAR